MEVWPATRTHTHIHRCIELYISSTYSRSGTSASADALRLLFFSGNSAVEVLSPGLALLFELSSAMPGRMTLEIVRDNRSLFSGFSSLLEGLEAIPTRLLALSPAH